MSDLNDQNPTVWSKAKDWIVGLTAVLVVLPALINAGIDVYKAALNIPKTDAEQINMELFKKYFNKPPVAAFPVPIKYSLGTAEAKFSIYEEGDVFVEYGNSSQWFPFPKPLTTRAANVSFISQAIAQQANAARGIGAYRQTDRFDGPTLARERVYDNGVIEQQRIDPRSGEILEQATRPSSDTTNNRQLAPFGVIDLETQKSRPPSNVPQATLCISQFGACALVVPIPKGAECSCYTSVGPAPGRAQ
jgi:hypothetical protein